MYGNWWEEGSWRGGGVNITVPLEDPEKPPALDGIILMEFSPGQVCSSINQATKRRVVFRES